MKKIISFILLLYASYTNAQFVRTVKTNINSWFMYFGGHKLSDQWGLHLEAQLRRSELVNTPQQILFRSGINYYFNANAFVTAGYAFVETYPYGLQPVKATFPEHRLWQQLQLKNQQGAFEIISRIRLEQRWMELPVLINNEYKPGKAVYQNRIRLLNRFSVPLKGKIIADKSIYISLYDEMMVNFGKQVAYNIFDQNRAYAAIGYKIPKLGKLEIGYMQQFIFKSDGVKVENNHTLQVGLTSNIDFHRKKS